MMKKTSLQESKKRRAQFKEGSRAPVQLWEEIKEDPTKLINHLTNDFSVAIRAIRRDLKGDSELLSYTKKPHHLLREVMKAKRLKSPYFGNVVDVKFKRFRNFYHKKTKAILQLLHKKISTFPT
uniref:Uncharacterized protein n=1 Tax=Lepeophtheirus salmonis TaxID=72036 RepID=A0A0K2TJ52_LEPSM